MVDCVVCSLFKGPPLYLRYLPCIRLKKTETYEQGGPEEVFVVLGREAYNAIGVLRHEQKKPQRGLIDHTHKGGLSSAAASRTSKRSDIVTFWHDGQI